jgi:hypothetical protein
MQIKVEFNEQQNLFVATYHDQLGLVGEGYGGETQEIAIFLLGCAFGRYPQKFSRELSQLLNLGE